MPDAKGRSLHIGLNRVDPDHYQGWDGALKGCEPDARDMEAIAAAQGFETRTLVLTEEGTAARVIAEISAAAEALVPGDLFFLTYSGHGSQVPDTNDEQDEDGLDETWVLYDRQLVDDELFELWSTFAAGVRILVLSDSCHSGSAIREVLEGVDPRILKAAVHVPDDEVGERRMRAMPPSYMDRTYKANRDLYEGIQQRCPSAERVGIGASVLLLSGCQDKQTSADGDANGLFTENLKAVWSAGGFQAGHHRFWKDIVDRMPFFQQPNFFPVGASSEWVTLGRPFTI